MSDNAKDDPHCEPVGKSKVTYNCDNDFYLVGAEEKTCLYNGTWDKDDPHCEPVGKSTIYLWQAHL